MTHQTRHHAHILAPAALLALATLLVSTFAAAAATPARSAAGPRYGGTVEVAYTSDATSFDPAQAYSVDWYIMNGTLFNGLYQFDRNAKPQLDLAAAAPTVSADQKTWTFQLRKGVLFSNGMELTAGDVKYSIMRTLDPHLKPAASWGEFSEPPFVGASDFIAGKTKDVPGIQVLGPYTIRFVLTQPTALFPYIMAESFNMVVPKAVVSKESEEAFNNNPIGTGPYILQSWTKGSKVVFVRNKHYFHTGKPYIDKIIVDLNTPSNLITLKIQKGEISGFGRPDQMSAADLQQVKGDPKYANWLKVTPVYTVDWLVANAKAVPTNNLKVRQAIAMAINRKRLVQLLGGQAIAAGNVYFPVDPQWDPALDAHPVYAYDPQSASATLKASGYKGQQVTLYFSNDYSYESGMSLGLQQQLQQIGLNVNLHGVSHTSLIALHGKPNGAALSNDDWTPDYFDGYDIYSNLMSCSGSSGAGAGSYYCDPKADALVNQASTTPLGPARDALLRQAQRRILQSATMIPLIYVKSTEFVSPKVGGFYYLPLFGWQYENYWLNP